MCTPLLCRLPDDSQHQKRPLALYAEGIKWLTIALKMFRGEIREFHGVKVTLPANDGVQQENSNVAK